MSLVINFGGKYYPPKSTAIGGPVQYESESSRVILHETLHYWQQFTHGFLARLAAEEWARLTEFLRTGERLPVGEYRQRYVKKDPKLGFSVRTLHEALTRGWEMHICNPREVLSFERKARLFTDESFWARFDELDAKGALVGRDKRSYTDIAYELGMEGAGGLYAAPFRYLAQRSDRSRAGVAFPLAANFALQTSEPLKSYAKIAPILADEVAPPTREDRIEELWVANYNALWKRAGEILDAAGLEQLPAESVIKIEFADHPGYQRGAERLARLTKDTWRVQAYQFSAGPPEPIRQRIAREVVLCTPGISEHRALLVAHLPPPLVRFEDGRIWRLGECWIEEYPKGAKFDARECHQDAEDALSIDSAWRKMVDSWP